MTMRNDRFQHLIRLTILAASLVHPAARWADLDTAAPKRHPSLPTVFLAGDSTVRNGSGRGADGLWGWGSYLDRHFDTAKIRIENRALGGRSSRTFITEGLWDKVVAELRPGDFVIIQFGHNDGGELAKGDRPRASLKGAGDESRDVIIEKTGKPETVHTYGWYLRKYIADAKARGATPIVCSPVPRNIWREGRVARAAHDYAKWAAEAATAGGAFFIDLNEMIARRYEEIGPERVAAEFFTAADYTHTTRAGAEENAAAVAEGIRRLEDCPLRDFLLPVWRFSFGGEAPSGFVRVTPQTAYDPGRGFGFLESNPARPDQPSVFAVDLEEGNYHVRLRLGDPVRPTSTTIKAESRRLMIEKVETAPGRFEIRAFTVNVRKPAIRTGGTTLLNPREKGPPLAPDWDDHLTFEFNGAAPGVATMEIKPAREAITVFLAGDSTVTDQPKEPYAAWGQMLPRFFQPGVAVANHAESGLALFSFERQRRLEKILSTMKPGDYLFIQFGHNDQKDKRPEAGPFTTYKANLQRFIQAARDRGGIPVLVTPMERRRWQDTGPQTTLADYAEAVRQTAAEERVPLIDLHAMSLKLYAALGPEASAKAFVHYPANSFPGQTQPLADNTHHSAYGAYELARCVVEGIKAHLPELAAHLVQDAGSFDPAKPDPPATVVIPRSPLRDRAEKPAGD